MIRKIVAWGWVLALLVALLIVSSVIMVALLAELQMGFAPMKASYLYTRTAES